MVYTFMCAPIQILTTTVLAYTLSRLLRDAALGWGDLVGAVIGVAVGPGIGLSIVLVLAGRALGRPTTSLVTIVLVAAPSAAVATIVTGVLGVSLPIAVACYLLASTVLVWWYCNRSSSTDGANNHRPCPE
jgi:hypothetical protein